MTYEELLDKWIRKLGRDCTAGEIVHDLRQLEQPEQPRNLYYEQLQKESDGEMEPTLDQVEAYCERRCLVLITSELFNEMKTRWSAEPVVRCKDCKHYNANHIECSRYGLKDDDFCSWGERKEDNG